MGSGQGDQCGYGILLHGFGVVEGVPYMTGAHRGSDGDVCAAKSGGDGATDQAVEDIWYLVLTAGVALPKGGGTTGGGWIA